MPEPETIRTLKNGDSMPVGKVRNWIQFYVTLNAP